MSKQAKLIVFFVIVGILFAVLLVRASQNKMIKPWPTKTTVEYKQMETDEAGVVMSETIETKQVFSWKGFWTWFAAFLTLCIISFLYDDNPFYKFAEHLFVGVSAAYWMVMGFWTTLVPNLFGKLTPGLVAKTGLIEGLEGVPWTWHYIFPLLLGIVLLMRLSSKYGWVSRWSLAFIVGTTAGLNFVQYLVSDFMMQISQSLKPLIVTAANVDPIISTSPVICSLSNILLFLGVFCGLIYFFFSVEHKGFFGAASRVGIWILMVSFGASFGFTVMGRIALLVGRMEFLFADWLNIIVQ